MTLRSLMQAGPAKATELFARLSETSDNAVKTRERLFAELKSELELHADLEEQHLFPLLGKQAETKELVANAIKDNKEMRARLDALENLPKNHETFLDKLTELQKAFRQHARDDKKELLPAVQRALSEEQVQTVAEKFETGLAEADQAKQDEAEERRMASRRQREQAEAAQQERETAERRAREMVDQTAASARQTAETMFRTSETVTENMRHTVRGIAEGTQRVATAPFTPFFFWDLMLGRSGGQQERSITPSGTGRLPVTSDADRGGAEEVIPLLEETLVIGKRVVNSGTTRVRRVVVESEVEQQVAL
jgi:hemerythrin-like domain-containing protein